MTSVSHDAYLHRVLSEVDSVLMVGCAFRTRSQDFRSEKRKTLLSLGIDLTAEPPEITDDSFEGDSDKNLVTETGEKLTEVYLMPLESSLWQFKLKYLRAWVILLLERHIELPRMASSLRGFFKSMETWTLGTFVPNLKYQLAYPYAKCTGDDLPLDPGCGPIPFTGTLRTWFKRRLARGSSKDVQMCWDILQMKRAMHVVPDSFVSEALKKHAKSVSGPPIPVGWATEESYRQKFRNLWRGINPSSPYQWEPSTSAGLTEARGRGGQREGIREELQADQHWHNGARRRGLLGEWDELVNMVETRPGVVWENRGMPTPSVGLLRTLAIRRSDEESKRGGGKLFTRAAPVKEPLKVRVITAGEKWSYWTSQFAQKAMREHLAAIPQFVALTRPLNASDMVRVTQRVWKISGDYSAATDTINIELTRLCFEVLLEELSSVMDPSDHEEFSRVLRRVLYEQHVAYDDLFAADWPKDHPELFKGGSPVRGYSTYVTQTQGQFMGSTLSFPILCAINFVTLWIARELMEGKALPMEEIDCLVNGDDIAFSVDTLKDYEVWKRCLRPTGLTLSLGKNYVNRRYFTINSMLFDSLHLERNLSYLPLGLLTGQQRVFQDDPSPKTELSELYSRCLTPARDRPLIHRLFLRYHRETINKLTHDGRMNLFADRFLGGLGFETFSDIPVRYTRFQRALGWRLWRDIERTLVSSMRLPGLSWSLETDKSAYRSRLVSRRVSLQPRMGPYLRGHRRRLEDASQSKPLLLEQDIPFYRITLDTDDDVYSEGPRLIRPRELFRKMPGKGWSTLGDDDLSYRYRLVFHSFVDPFKEGWDQLMDVLEDLEPIA